MLDQIQPQQRTESQKAVLSRSADPAPPPFTLNAVRIVEKYPSKSMSSVVINLLFTQVFRGAPLCFLCLFVATSFLTSVFAQPYVIDWYTIDGGGGDSIGGDYTLTGTIGQPDTGMMTGGDYAIEGGFWSVIVAVQTPGAPLVEINLAGDNPGNLEISWPVGGSTGFTLEEATSLTSPINWQPVVIEPVVVDDMNVVTLPVLQGDRFYRLIRD